MRLKRFAPLLFASLSLCSFNTFQSVEASIKKQFQNQSSCSFETATFESVDKTDSGDKRVYRYCISPDKRVMLYGWVENNSYWNGKDPWIQKGFLGKNEVEPYAGETIFGGYESGIRIWFWDIEEDELVRYVCETSDYSNCSDEVERKVMAKKIVINQRLQQSLEVKTLKYPNGTYVGEVEGDNIENGKGTMTFNDGNKYVGEFKDGKYNGFGKFYKNGFLVYEGNHINNIREGKGSYYYNEGSKYEGDFKNNLPHGTGVFTWADGTSKCMELINGEFKRFC